MKSLQSDGEHSIFCVPLGFSAGWTQSTLTHTPESAILFNLFDSLSHPLPLRLPLRELSLQMAFCLRSLSWRPCSPPKLYTRPWHTAPHDLSPRTCLAPKEGIPALCTCAKLSLPGSLQNTASRCDRFFVWQTLLGVEAPWCEDCEEDVWGSAGI